MKKNTNKKVSIVMGSQSDYKTMRLAEKTLKQLGISFETKIVSAHRTPKRMYDFALKAEKNNIGVIIAGAGGSAHLPGMVASKTLLPVIGVPILSSALSGIDSLYSIVQMPKGCPVATMAIGIPGAINSSIFAISILALNNENISKKLKIWHKKKVSKVPMVPKDE